jgi:3-hydroxyacyl-[acyl-carrier-protein] dehydratase
MRWMWIDRVTELQPRHKLVAVKNVSLAEEHLHDHFPAEPARGLLASPVMPASLIVEGCAQTGGILVGHAEAFKHKVILAKVNKFQIDRDATPGCTLRYTAIIERMDDMGASVNCTIELFDFAKPEAGFAAIGSIALMFSHLDHNMGAAGQAGQDFPAHNFVFGDAFKTLLRSSGYAVQ